MDRRVAVFIVWLPRDENAQEIASIGASTILLYVAVGFFFGSLHIQTYLVISVRQ